MPFILQSVYVSEAVYTIGLNFISQEGTKRGKR